MAASDFPLYEDLLSQVEPTARESDRRAAIQNMRSTINGLLPDENPENKNHLEVIYALIYHHSVLHPLTRTSKIPKIAYKGKSPKSGGGLFYNLSAGHIPEDLLLLLAKYVENYLS